MQDKEQLTINKIKESAMTPKEKCQAMIRILKIQVFGIKAKRKSLKDRGLE